MLDDFILRAILQATAFKFSREKSKRFAALLTEDVFVFQVRTRKACVGHFILKDGRISYRSGRHAQPDLEQIWRSARDAVTVMTSKDEAAMNRAFVDGRCSMVGRFTVAIWFNEAVKIIKAPKVRQIPRQLSTGR